MTTLGPVRKLSPRKQEIAELVAKGLTNPQIARELSRRHNRPMAVNTVRSHIRAMAFIFDDPPELPPRQRILLWLRQGEWARERELPS
jgi:DNA-binding CsgD family transcriptional regulator